MTILRAPTLLDMLGVCMALPEDEQRTYEILSGQQYQPEDVAHGLWAKHGPRWCIADERDFPLVVCGYERMHPGTFRSWFCATSDAWERYGTEITSITQELIRGVLAEPNVNRLETITLASRAKARRWYDRIGLRLESEPQGFGVNGEAAAMYVALRGREQA